MKSELSSDFQVAPVEWLVLSGRFWIIPASRNVVAFAKDPPAEREGIGQEGHWFTDEALEDSHFPLGCRMELSSPSGRVKDRPCELDPADVRRVGYKMDMSQAVAFLVGDIASRHHVAGRRPASWIKEDVSSLHSWLDE